MAHPASSSVTRCSAVLVLARWRANCSLSRARRRGVDIIIARGGRRGPTGARPPRSPYRRKPGQPGGSARRGQAARAAPASQSAPTRPAAPPASPGPDGASSWWENIIIRRREQGKYRFIVASFAVFRRSFRRDPSSKSRFTTARR